ncbi:hypothetical protein Cpir12675_003190 [Ceratocystis pirilliformis]|uniref:Uncharacterized protein n=1 Tax=Ceratocystis pirilliformis TaxID=259994 RepID=A0ABR3Z5R4_9PEZI
MPSISHVILQRSEDESSDTLEFNRMLSAFGLVMFALCLVSSLVLLRRAQLRRQASLAPVLPSYSEARGNNLTIHTTDKHGRSSVLVIGSNGKPMLSNPNSPPHSADNVPEIRITFPDEADQTGQNQSGRVVVVRMGDSSVGLEPMNEQLPAYEKESKTQFYSIDMDQIGGLKEKDTRI